MATDHINDRTAQAAAPPAAASPAPAPHVGDAGAARAARGRMSDPAGFWLVGTIMVLLLFSSSAPSPMYAIYAQKWNFSSTTLTVVFAVYAVAVLVSLLLFGSLSDAIGRRRTLLLSLAIGCASMVIFAVAPDVGWLLTARVVQGIAVGLATGALSAALIELAPKPALGTLVNGVSPTLGMAVGALVAGALVQFAPKPTVLTYLLLLVLFAACFVGVLFMPETAPNAGQVKVRPRRVSIPAGAGKAFAIFSLGLVAVWAVGGFYLSLGPSLALQLLKSHSHFVGGLSVTVLAGLATLGQLAFGKTAPLRAAIIGLSALIVGLVLVLISVAQSTTWLFFVGTAVLGLGWGTSFLGAFRSLAGLAEPKARGELMAAVYVVAYLAMSVPAVIAGLVSSHLGLHRTAEDFTVAVGIVCLIALVGMRWATARREPAA